MLLYLIVQTMERNYLPVCRLFYEIKTIHPKCSFLIPKLRLHPRTLDEQQSDLWLSSTLLCTDKPNITTQVNQFLEKSSTKLNSLFTRTLCSRTQNNGNLHILSIIEMYACKQSQQVEIQSVFYRTWVGNLFSCLFM